MGLRVIKQEHSSLNKALHRAEQKVLVLSFFYTVSVQ